VEDRVVWEQNGLRAQSTARGKQLVLKLPSRVLTQGEYRLMLQGRIAGGQWDKVDNYDFRLVIR
jgi:hypothetical protein